MDGPHFGASGVKRCRAVRRHLGAALAWLLLGALPGCNGALTESSPAVAKVGDQVLTAAELDLMLRGSLTDAPTSEARWNAVERWVNRELLYREAIRRGVDEQPDVRLQVQTAVRELVINALLDQVFRNKLAVTEGEVQQYYSDRRALFRRSETTVRVRQIVLDDVREARELQRLLSRNPERFESIARSRSNDPSSSEGGDIGYISAETAYNAEIWQVVQRLSDNEVSRPISTDAGWHILKVEDRRPAGSIKTFDEVRLDIVNRLRTAKRIALLTELVERQKLREPYLIKEDVLGPRSTSVPKLPLGVDSLDSSQ